MICRLALNQPISQFGRGEAEELIVDQPVANKNTVNHCDVYNIFVVFGFSLLWFEARRKERDTERERERRLTSFWTDKHRVLLDT